MGSKSIDGKGRMKKLWSTAHMVLTKALENKVLFSQARYSP